MPLRLYNTLTKQKEDFVPADPTRVTFYTCGLTVYDYGHIGNFRSFLAADVLRRWVESPLCDLSDGRGGVNHGPRAVVHVMNVTDVGHMTDDAEGGESGEDRMAVAGKRLLEAKKSGKLPAGVEIDPRDPYAIAKFYTDCFVADAKKLGLKVVIDAEKDPTLMPRATANVAGMIKVVERLIARGHAYCVGEPGSRVVYFRVKSFAPYGRLSGNTLDALREGEGGRVSSANQSNKEHPADFLLWKEDPTHIMKWDSPWGAGYPGWHIECTVMSARRLLGDGVFESLLARPTAGDAIIDLHSGGEDNIFPHHECEIAQSCGAFCADPSHGTFSRSWFHPRFLMVEGAKMSKSKGNFFTAQDMFARGISAAALRLELIKTHYRSNANFTMQGLADNQRIIDRWRRVADAGPAGGPEFLEQARGDEAARAFADALNDDLNIASAIATVNGWINQIGTPTPRHAALMRMFDGVLGVVDLDRGQSTQTELALFAPGVEPSAKVEELLRRRREARAAKDFKASDAIRDELAAMGYAIKDAPGGKVEVRRA
ncbi:MAG: cysteine--tRNA ligase [Planctomycetes bacterium]|nr:cysteine--tRNA ligase [Planctomycetota bacterium]